jgi:hypothetical protein
VKQYQVICNAPEDDRLATILRNDLKRAGIAVWVGVSKNTESKYAIGVAEAIKKASHVLFIGTRNSVNSPTVKMELAAAARTGVPILQISVDDISFHTEMKLATLKENLDFRKDYKNAFGNLVDILMGPKPDEEDAVVNLADNFLFLSYAQEDTDVVNEIKEFLKRKQVAYWEYQESYRNYQANLNVELEDVIKAAKLTVAILSEDWKKSEWSLKEMSFSQEIGTPVVLLKFKQMGATLATAGIPYIDFMADRDKAYVDFTKELMQKGLIK